MGRLACRVALVTGAASGIGRAVTRAFAAEGAAVHAVDVTADRLAEVLEGLRAEGLAASTTVADISNPEDVERTVARVLDASGRIDCLANIAGVISSEPVEEVSLAEWDRILGINLRGTFLCARAVVPAMKGQGSGSIINVSSRAGAMGFAGMTAYCASKFGVEGLSRALAQELAPHGIAVNTITPGTPVHTAMSETTYSPEQRRIWRDPAVIAPAFVHLALQGPDGLNDRYVNAWDLTQELEGGGGS
ncbi:MAG: SDR family oxidoreductase [Immundisolibacterales bacterium]|nr:SDR family oxidoreductase [Immundisolibacterales bacterium]